MSPASSPPRIPSWLKHNFGASRRHLSGCTPYRESSLTSLLPPVPLPPYPSKLQDLYLHSCRLVPALCGDPVPESTRPLLSTSPQQETRKDPAPGPYRPRPLLLDRSPSRRGPGMSPQALRPFPAAPQAALAAGAATLTWAGRPGSTGLRARGNEGTPRWQTRVGAPRHSASNPEEQPQTGSSGHVMATQPPPRPRAPSLPGPSSRPGPSALPPALSRYGKATSRNAPLERKGQLP